MKYLSRFSKKDLSKEICILRVDLNLKSLSDFFRINAILPSIKFLLKRKAKILILSHRGRPKANLKGERQKLSLRPIGKILARKLNRKVFFLPNFDFVKIKEQIVGSAPASIFLLENLRFLKEEEANSSVLAQKLADLGDFYVNDAFAVSHRANASVAAITEFLPSYSGLLLENELRNLSFVMRQPKKPFVVIIGGIKLDDKIGVIKNFKNKAGYFLFGSSVLNNENYIKKIKYLLKNKNYLLPIDGVQDKDYFYDIGRQTVEQYKKIIKNAKTIIWNGPVGMAENKKYSFGSAAIAKALVNSGAFTVIGGGETTNLIIKLKLQKKIGFLSTGGGAMLDFLAGKTLPGVAAIDK